MTHLTPASVKAEAIWLLAHPEFEERPATIEEFLGPDYLNCEKHMRARIVEELKEIIGHELQPDRMTAFALAIITGGIGIGKTTIAAIVLSYLAHWCLCLKDPQDFFGLLPGSRIAFMQMSTSEKQALEVVFGDIKARIEHSPWFQKYPVDPTYKNQIRFKAKDVWIIPGDSAETTFEGYNILGGILDEADSHKVTEAKDYAEQGYNTIANRVSSRFQDRGFLLVIGQMKSSTGFAARKFAEFKTRPDAYAVRMAIWDSFGEDFYAERSANGKLEIFYYDTHRKQIIPDQAALAVIGAGKGDNVLKIPQVYLNEFENGPEKALKDLAGIPPAVGDPFISLVYKIDAAMERWSESHDQMPNPVDEGGRFDPGYRALEGLKRCAHLDIAYSPDGDALGFAMGHVRNVVEIDGELKPYIIIDLVMRLKAPAGGEIMLADVRHKIYALRDDMRFKLKRVTFDTYQSQDTEQQLRKRRFEADKVSVDKDLLPYTDLREAIYEDRIEFPPFMVRYQVGDGHKVNIVQKELMELVDNGKKIDHPEGGSKDVADCLAGVTFTLMGDRRYRRGVVRLSDYRDRQPQKVAAGGVSHPAFLGARDSLVAPVPPTDWGRSK